MKCCPSFGKNISKHVLKIWIMMNDSSLSWILTIFINTLIKDGRNWFDWICFFSMKHLCLSRTPSLNTPYTYLCAVEPSTPNLLLDIEFSSSANEYVHMEIAQCHLFQSLLTPSLELFLHEPESITCLKAPCHFGYNEFLRPKKKMDKISLRLFTF